MPNYHTRQKEIQRSLEMIVEELQSNEEHFWQLIEAMPSVVVIVDPRGEITYINKRVEEIFGYHPDELIGKSVDMLLPEDFQDRHSAHRSSYFMSPSNRTMGRGMDLVACRKDKSVFPVEIGLGYLNTHGEGEAIAFIVDITERKQVEDTLIKSERLLKKAQEIAHVGNSEVNLKTGETIWSDEFFRICGLEPQSITPTAEMSISIIHPDDRDNTLKVIEQLLETGEPYEIEKRIVRPNGEIRWVISQGEVTVEDITGTQSLLRVFIDITERKQAQQRERDLNLERERNQMLARFIQNISHEFRTPLTIINSSVQLMSLSDDRDKRLQKAETIQEHVMKTTNLIEVLLFVVELETIHQLDSETVSLADIQKSICYSMNSVYKDKLTLICNKPTDNEYVLGDSAYLYRAIEQIIDNACRFTPQGGTVTLSFSHRDDYIRITVEDTGIGISEADLPHIFEKFWRQDVAHSTPGFGLGLSLVKKIIDLHNGTITVNSVVDEGTIVQVDLPIQKPDIA